MIEFTLRGKVKFAVDFTFFATIALFFYFDEYGYGLMGICACLIHEIGHLIALYIEKRDFKSFTFYGGGIKINYEKSTNASVFLITAGCLLNIIFFLLFYFVLSVSFNLKVFAVVNLIIGIFNFLPFRYFDGGHLLEKFLIKTCNHEKALHVLRKTEKITAFITLAILFLIVVSARINTSVFVIMIYIFISDITLRKK